MTKEEIKELEERTYAIGWSGFPIDTLFNDIRDNNNPRFNKDLAYQDFKKIIDEIYRLKDKAKKYDKKETSKKPIKRQEVDKVVGEYVAYDCPCCKKEQIFKFKNVNKIVGFKAKYCHKCGQKLDWSDEDDK